MDQGVTIQDLVGAIKLYMPILIELESCALSILFAAFGFSRSLRLVFWSFVIFWLLILIVYNSY